MKTGWHQKKHNRTNSSGKTFTAGSVNLRQRIIKTIRQSAKDIGYSDHIVINVLNDTSYKTQAYILREDNLHMRIVVNINAKDLDEEELQLILSDEVTHLKYWNHDKEFLMYGMKEVYPIIKKNWIASK
jgi:hypothetical protein